MIGISVFLFVQLSKPTPDEILQAEKEVYAFLLVELKLNAKKYLLEYTNSGEIRWSGEIITDPYFRAWYRLFFANKRAQQWLKL
jgi:hypothetical protein